MQSTTKYQAVASHEAKKGEFKKAVLLYSGGLDTSVMLKWIQDEYEADIIALTIDIGQNENFAPIKEKALKLGAVAAHVIDAKEEFANNYLSKAIKANANYQGGYHLFCPLGRAIISKVGVDIAHQENAQVIAHGCTGKGNDQVRFEGYITTLDPKLKTIAPVREWAMGREEELEYAAKHGIPVSQTAKKIYSYDENLWGDSAEGGEIEKVSMIPPLDNILINCKNPKNAPDQSETLEIDFEEGLPVAVNGEKISLFKIIKMLGQIGAKHGVGITHLIEDRIVGLKVRGVYEEPAAEILIQAHYNLEKLVCTRDENEFKSMVDQKWAYMCYGAKWFHPLMDHLNAYIDSVNKKVCGTVTVELYKGKVSVVAVKSKYSLFNENLATFMKNSSFNQNSSAGFIELWNLPQKTAHNLTKDIYKSHG
ncbi:argininosuccinate synthase [Candidatus Peregrinibacteria bacterium]|nr:argininosuccinate synthase [Candidatus Peregrinibacteria bacterium]